MRKTLAHYWEKIQGSLFPALEEELPPLTQKQQQLISILELIRIEEFLPTICPGYRGRPIASRKAIARAFVAKVVYNIPTTTMLIDRLNSDISLRRICGWETRRQMPSESSFSRAFAEFAESQLASKVHEFLIQQVYKDKIVVHAITDSAAITAREAPVKKEPKPLVKEKRVRAKKGEPTLKEMTRLERQFRGDMSLDEMVKELPKVCDVGAKTNSKGHLHFWIGYKLHLTSDDNGVPLTGLTCSASLNDTQVAIPLAQLTAQRVVSLYDLMDGGYYADRIVEHSISMGHIPIMEKPAKTDQQAYEKRQEEIARETLNWQYPHEARYDERTTAERVFSRLRDEFGVDFIRVRGSIKVASHLMFGVLVLAADQLLKIAGA
jgi:transposase